MKLDSKLHAVRLSLSPLFDESYVTICQSLKKVQSSCPGQVVFHGWASNFHSHLPNDQGVKRGICKLNIGCVTTGQVTFESFLSAGQAGM